MGAAETQSAHLLIQSNKQAQRNVTLDGSLFC